jgi:hypothetical protein
MFGHASHAGPDKNFLNQLGLVERNQSTLKEVQLEEVQAHLEALSMTESISRLAA